MADLASLVTPLTTDEARETIYSVLAATGVTTTNWKPGAVVRTLVTAMAICVAALSSLIALIAASGFLQLATGVWLTLVARYVYGVERIQAVFASGSVTATNSSGANYTLDPGDLIVFNPTTQKSYVNTALITLNGGTSVTSSFRAVEAGSASTSFPGEITGVTSALTGVTCTNALALAGYDDEQDAALRTRCTDKLGALSPNGPSDAYSFAARNALRLDGTAVGVTRVKPVRSPNGVLTVYVASASGALTGSATDPATDLGAVQVALLHNAAPLVITATAATVINTPISVSYSVWLYNTTSMAPADVQAAIALQLQDYLAAQPIGGNVISPDVGRIYNSALEAAIGRTKDSSGAVLPFFRVQIVSPTFDTALASNAVAVPGVFTAGINIVAGG